MTRPGFTFIEISIALMIISGMSLLLYQSFMRMQRTLKVTEDLMDYTRTMPEVYNQLEKDITAIFVPLAALSKEKTEQKPESTSEQNTEKKPEQKTEEKKYTDIFNLTASEKNLKTLTFFSTHSLNLYNTIVPYKVRIVYNLEPQENGLFKLTRQEDLDLRKPIKDFAKNKIRSYDLLTNIKELTVRCFVPEKPTEKSGKKQDQQAPANPQVEQPKKLYKEVTAWTDKEREKLYYYIPAFVQISGTIIEALTDLERSFIWEFKVFAFDGVAELQKLAQKKETKPQEKQKAKEDTKEEESSGMPEEKIEP